MQILKDSELQEAEAEASRAKLDQEIANIKAKPKTGGLNEASEQPKIE